MATIKLVSPEPGAVFWRAARGSVKSLPGEPISSVITIELLKTSYYTIAVDELGDDGEVVKSFPPFEEKLFQYGEYEINGQTGEFKQIS